jgi:hypothetical protein
MADNKLTKILMELVQKTDKGSLAWEPTAEEGVYQVSFPRFTVQLSPNGPDIVLSILNSEGTIIEEAADAEFSDHIPAPYQTMKKLYANARRQALGVDAALDELLDELSKKDSLLG